MKLFAIKTQKRPLLPEFQTTKPSKEGQCNPRDVAEWTKISLKKALYQFITRFHQPRIKSLAVAIFICKDDVHVLIQRSEVFVFFKLCIVLLCIFPELHSLQSSDTSLFIGFLLSGPGRMRVNVRMTVEEGEKKKKKKRQDGSAAKVIG